MVGLRKVEDGDPSTPSHQDILRLQVQVHNLFIRKEPESLGDFPEKSDFGSQGHGLPIVDLELPQKRTVYFVEHQLVTKLEVPFGRHIVLIEVARV